jgi:hypothetical protein
MEVASADRADLVLDLEVEVEVGDGSPEIIAQTTGKILHRHTPKRRRTQKDGGRASGRVLP